MQELIQALKALLELQTSQVALAEELFLCLEAEENAASGFELSALNKVIGQKDQVVHRFASLETRRLEVAGRLAFLIGFDLRNSSPTVTSLVLALEVYNNSIAGLLSGEQLESVQKAVQIFVEETRKQTPVYKEMAFKIQRNKSIVTKVLSNINQSVRFFEQAFQVNDVSYNQGGKTKSTYRGSRSSSSINVKV